MNALLYSMTYVQLGLITVLGNRGCVAVASFLGVRSAQFSSPGDLLCSNDLFVIFETLTVIVLFLYADPLAG
jgi:hypothetical protein